MRDGAEEAPWGLRGGQAPRGGGGRPDIHVNLVPACAATLLKAVEWRWQRGALKIAPYGTKVARAPGPQCTASST